MAYRITLRTAPRGADPAYPLVLSTGERRDYTANTICRDPAWRRKGRDGALRPNPHDADGGVHRTGVTPKELTRCEDRDEFAGTPWHEFVPARLEPA